MLAAESAASGHWHGASCLIEPGFEDRPCSAQVRVGPTGASKFGRLSGAGPALCRLPGPASKLALCAGAQMMKKQIERVDNLTRGDLKNSFDILKPTDYTSLDGWLQKKLAICKYIM